ncbi:hypothetical protein TpMuguga_02g02370 [Theileria parva strain Muguga]|uniref:uncharacterized protein n=1 Tax=Theileria parva strain Muguga TaxID=333668 RepID=UPI001C616F6E|nr:uncharacterized protein TpMuguga_02g02370 [Theileria parva strain Muguga]KAF5153649.1 hypothetical protein TpMuguga_02g02370 [Theileria parva strain Muguga]
MAEGLGSQVFEGISPDFIPLDSEYSATVHSSARHKTQKELEKEEILRKLQGLVSGDRLFFKKSTLGQQVSNPEIPTTNDFVESKLVYWIYDKMSIYLLINIDPYGKLRFTYGDLYQMAVSHDLFFHKLETRFVKNIKSDHSTGYKRVDTVKSQLNLDTIDILRPESEKKSINYDIKSRPTPAGVESFCKCKFSNKTDFIKKLRLLIKTSKSKFMDKTAEMKELRLITSQNIRTYELEIVGYIMDENPWNYSTNPWEEPEDGKKMEIVEMYKKAVNDPTYKDLYRQWLSKCKLLINQTGTSIQKIK